MEVIVVRFALPAFYEGGQWGLTLSPRRICPDSLPDQMGQSGTEFLSGYQIRWDSGTETAPTLAYGPRAQELGVSHVLCPI